MAGIEDFFAPKEVEEGIELSLCDSAGKPTESWIRVRSIDSDSYRKTFHAIQREVLEKAKEGASEAEYAELIEERRPMILASLIASWSPDITTECNDENKRKLVEHSPINATAIENIAQRRSLFVKKKLPDSSQP